MSDASRDALYALGDADKAFKRGDYQRAVSYYRQAISIVQGLPKEYMFDRGVFQAMCNAQLCAALGKLERPEESLVCAEAALQFYEQWGNRYAHVEFGRWVATWINMGAALAALGRLDEALSALLRGSQMLEDGKLSSEGQALLEQTKQDIQRIKDAQGRHTMRQRPVEKKKWWEFWR